MVDAVSLTARSMNVDMQRVLTVSQNLAQAETPAYKRLVAVTRSFDAYMSGSPTGVGDVGVQLDTVADRTPATLISTGRWSDLAIEGDGYFELQGANGPVYARRGDFRLDAQGRLVSHDGLAVAMNGTSVVPSTGVSIDGQGRILDGDRNVGQLRLVKVENPDTLWQGADGYLHANATTRVNDQQAVVRQGFLENSNVSSTREMLHLMEAVRHFESGQRVIQSYDEMLGKSLGRFAEL